MDKCCDNCFHLLTTELCMNCNVHSSVCSNIQVKPPTLHTIKPLEWSTDSYDGVWSITGLRTYFVNPLKPEGYEWGFYAGGEFIGEPCDSIEDGKAQAEAHYRAQLLKCLEVYRG